MSAGVRRFLQIGVDAWPLGYAEGIATLTGEMVIKPGGILNPLNANPPVESQV